MSKPAEQDHFSTCAVISHRMGAESPWTAGSAWRVRSALSLDLLDLSIAAEQPVLLAFKPMLIGSIWLLAAGGALTAVFTLLASIAAVSTTRRLQVLLDGFLALARDDFVTRLPQSKVRGQLDHLYRGFNAVAGRMAIQAGAKYLRNMVPASPTATAWSSPLRCRSTKSRAPAKYCFGSR